jgi:hypothetical protein
MASALKGFDDLVKALATLANKTTKKAAKAGANVGLTVLVKEMRRAVNGSSASPELKRAARKTLAKRLRKKEGKEYSGKAGFAVGKQSKAKGLSAHGRHMVGQGGMKGSRTMVGTGLSASNIHWPALGTKGRTQTMTGRETGAMPAILKGVIDRAASTAGPAMLTAARNKIAQVLAADAVKVRKKG